MRWPMWLVITAIVAVPAWLYWPADARVHLMAAQQRWAGRAFADYRLVVETDTCLYDVVVRAGRLYGGARDSCVTQARTVEGLFALIAATGMQPRCIAGTCLCLVHTSVAATYDAALGHPVRINIRSVLMPHLASADYWRALMRWRRLPACHASATRHIRVQDVAPLPDD